MKSITALFIEEQLKQSEKLISNNEISKENSLFEYRVINCVGPRQAGYTTAIAQLIDTTKDLYITTSSVIIDSLVEKHNQYNGQHISRKNITSVIIPKDLSRYNIVEKDLAKFTDLVYDEIEKCTGLNVLDPFKDNVLKSQQSHMSPASMDFLNKIRGRSIDGTVWLDISSYNTSKYPSAVNTIIRYIDALHGNKTTRYVIV